MSGPGQGIPAGIRPIGAFDVALLAEMHRAIFTAPWDQRWSADSFAQSLAMPGACGWLLEQQAEPLGFVLARFVLDEGEILLTGILPAARGQGHATRLMGAVIDAARAAGLKRLFLEHADVNREAARLYGGLGFTQIGRRPQYYAGELSAGRRHDAITLALDLTATEPPPAARVEHRG